MKPSEKGYYGIVITPSGRMRFTICALFTFAVVSAIIFYFGCTGLTNHIITQITRDNKERIVAIQRAANGSIPIQVCDTDNVTVGVFIVSEDQSQIIGNPLLDPNLLGLDLQYLSWISTADVEVGGIFKGFVNCCPLNIEGAICAWQNAAYTCTKVANSRAATLNTTLGLCHVNFFANQSLGTDNIIPPLDATPTTPLTIEHDVTNFENSLLINGTHQLPNTPADVLVAANYSRAFTGFDYCPCGNANPNFCGNRAEGTRTLPLDLTMTSFFTGRTPGVIDTTTLQGDQRDTPTQCASGFPITPNPYLGINTQNITEDNLSTIPISQLAEDILKCGNPEENIPVPLGATPSRVFDPSRTWATSPVFPIARGAVYEVYFGTDLINLFPQRDDDDQGFQDGFVQCTHYATTSFDDDDTCKTPGDLAESGAVKAPPAPTTENGQTNTSPGRKNTCDAQSRTANLGPVAFQLYALCLGVSTAPGLYVSQSGLVTNMFVTIHHMNPVIIDMSSGAKTHKMRGHAYLTIDDEVFDAHPGYSGQCAMFSAATPFYMEQTFTEQYPHIYTPGVPPYDKFFNDTPADDTIHGYNHFCRVENIMPVNAFIEVRATIPGLREPISVIASGQASSGTFSITSKRGITEFDGPYDDVNEMSSMYWQRFIDPVTGKIDWEKRKKARKPYVKTFVDPKEALKAYEKRILKRHNLSQKKNKKKRV